MPCIGWYSEISMPVMTFSEVCATLKQRFPMIMVDAVLALEPGKSIRTAKNVTGNEIQFLGHFPDCPIMPGTLIIEAMGQSACILFAKTAGSSPDPSELLVLGSVQDLRFLAPVWPGDRMEIEARVIKFVQNIALVGVEATVDETVVAKGKLGFARRNWRSLDPAHRGSTDS